AEQTRRHIPLPQDLARRLLEVLGLALLKNQHHPLAAAEALPLFGDQRIGDVEHVEWHATGAEGVGIPEQLEGTQRVVVQTALQRDADVGNLTLDEFVQAARGDEALRGRQALLDLLALLGVGRWRQDDAAVVAPRLRQGIGRRERRPAIVLRGEAAIDVA